MIEGCDFRQLQPFGYGDNGGISDAKREALVLLHQHYHPGQVRCAHIDLHNVASDQPFDDVYLDLSTDVPAQQVADLSHDVRCDQQVIGPRLQELRAAGMVRVVPVEVSKSR
jgi:hypothetical protein